MTRLYAACGFVNAKPRHVNVVVRIFRFVGFFQLSPQGLKYKFIFTLLEPLGIEYAQWATILGKPFGFFCDRSARASICKFLSEYAVYQCAFSDAGITGNYYIYKSNFFDLFTYDSIKLGLYFFKINFYVGGCFSNLVISHVEPPALLKRY